MQPQPPTSLHWPKLLGALRSCAADRVLIRDGKVTEPAGAVRSRPAARGTELCLYPGEAPIARTELIERLEALAKSSGRRFASSARANVNESYLLVDSVADEEVDGKSFTVIVTRRPTLGFNPSQQTGSRTHLRSKRIKTT